jgi:hypothetical protein
MLVAGEAEKQEPETGRSADDEGQSRPGLLPSAETGLALAGTVGLVYVIGGAVMWLRFRHAHLPADQAVALLPKTDLLVAGLRVMILPALLSAAFLVALACWQNARVDRIEKRLGRPTEGEHRLLPQPGSRRRRVVIAASAAMALVFALILPFSPGAFVWPLVLLAIVVYWQRLWSSSHEEGESRPKPSLLHIAAVAVIASVLVSIARQVDPMTQLPSVAVTLAPDARGSRPTTVTGVLVTATNDIVAVGDPRARSISTYPRDRVTAISVQPPLAPQTPPRSLVSKLMFHDAWAWTPLKVWCGGDGYGWTRLGSACQARPRAMAGSLKIVDDSVQDLQIECPPQAVTPCRGFVFIKTTALHYDSKTGTVRPYVLVQQSFNVPEGKKAEITLPFDRTWDSTLATHTRVRVSLTRDALGKQIMFEDAAVRTLSISSTEKSKVEKKVDKKKSSSTASGPANGQDHQNRTGGGGKPRDDQPNDTSPEATPTPEETPTPEANPLVPPPSDDEIAAPPTPTPTP